MVQVNDRFTYTVVTLIDSGSLFTSPIWQAMQTQEISVIGLDDMFFGFVTKQGADISKVGRLRNLFGKCFLRIALCWFLGCEKRIEYSFRPVVKETNRRVS